MKFNLKQKLLTVNLVVVVMMSCVLLAGLYEIHQANRTYAELLEAKGQEVMLAKDAQVQMVVMGFSARGYFLDGQESHLSLFRAANSKAIRDLKELQKQVKSPEGKKYLETILKQHADYVQLSSDLFLKIAEGKRAEALAGLPEVSSRVQKLIDSGNLFVNLEEKQLALETEKNKSEVENIISLILVACIIVVAVSLWLTIYISSTTANPIKSVAAHVEKLSKGNLILEELKSSRHDELGLLAKSFNKLLAELKAIVGEMSRQSSVTAGFVDSLKHHLTEASSGVVKTASATTQISLDIEGLARESERLSRRFSEVSQSAEEGSKGLAQMVQQMQEITGASSFAYEKIRAVTELSDQISVIAQTITEIAEQTNLLALNAAIEAARAGDAGFGFAVVAEEVRNLAEKSKQAAESIDRLAGNSGQQLLDTRVSTEQSIKSVAAGNEIVEYVTGNLNQIIHEVQGLSGDLKRMVFSVESMSRELKGVANYSEQQAATIQEIAASSDTLSNLSVAMQQSVNRFILEA